MTFAPGHTFALLVAGDTDPMVERYPQLPELRRLVARRARRPPRDRDRAPDALGLSARCGECATICSKVREGDIQHLEGDYPSEIEPLVQDLNALIDSNREIVERARTHVGNLAHALKTPLAVLQNESAASREPLAAKVAEQTGIMRSQVEHHLNRARIAAQANVLGAVTPIEPTLAALARVMGKVHQDRQLAIELDVPAGPALPRRKAGLRGDGGQSPRQCLQMGEDRACA